MLILQINDVARILHRSAKVIEIQNILYQGHRPNQTLHIHSKYLNNCSQEIIKFWYSLTYKSDSEVQLI